MQPQSSFDALSRVLERLGSGDRTVRRAEAAADGDADGPLRSTVEVAVPLSEAFDAEARTGSDGRSTGPRSDGLEISIRFPVFPSRSAGEAAVDLPAGMSVSTDARDVQIEDGEALLTLTVTIDTASTDSSSTGSDPAADSPAEPSPPTSPTDPREEFTRGGTAAATTDAATSETAKKQVTPPSLSEIRDESVPPYDDTAYLERLYDVCETFEEMSQRIEMDVSAETVRRYMIDADVHAPASYDTAAAEGPTESESEYESMSTGERSDSTAEDLAHGSAPTGASAASLPDEQLVTDGIGFPERLTLHDVVDAVLEARTVHEVQRELGLEHDRTRQLLRQLNVLDLVLRRVAANPGREVTAEDVAARIRESAPDAQ